MSTQYIEELVNIPSPTGYTTRVIEHVERSLQASDWTVRRNNKGSLLAGTHDKPRLVMSAHIDTLGGMVSRIKSDGTLEIAQLGGWPPNSFEGEYVTVLTRSGTTCRGTFLLNEPAAHVNREVGKTEREMGKMHIRLDLESDSEKATQKAGLSIGDFVFFDPRFEVTESGFVKSRFLDDKACAGIFLDIQRPGCGGRPDACSFDEIRPQRSRLESPAKNLPMGTSIPARIPLPLITFRVLSR